MKVVSQSPDQAVWAPVDGTDSVYVNQVVQSTGDGVAPLGAASGAADTTNKVVPYGCVIGTDVHPAGVFSSVTNSDVVTGVQTQALQVARDFEGAEGQWVKGDPQPKVQISLITAETILEAPLYNSTLGTAPTVLTVTTGSTDGLGFTSNATDFTPVADLCTSIGRSGANEGIMRISDDTSTTVSTNDRAFPYDIAVGDTLIRVPLRPIGQSFVQFDSESTFIDVSASPATDYFIIDVLRLDLDTAGEEKVYFRFNPVHFDPARA
jgi:hypothetical protein